MIILDSNFYFYLDFTVQTISYTLTLFVSNYVLPLLVIVVCYYYIVKAIFHHENEIREQARKMNVAWLQSNNHKTTEIRIAQCALINVSLWIVMWTPYAFIALQGALGDQSKITPLVTTLPALIAKSASIVNPIVFAISHPKYQRVSVGI